MLEERIRLAILGGIEQNEYVRVLQLSFEEMKEGRCVGKMKVNPQILNPYKTVHGGALYSLADIVAGCAACTYGNWVCTVEGQMHFLLPAQNTEYITCEATCQHAGSKIITMEVKLTNDEGKVLETGVFTFFNMNIPVVSE